jgi:LEA14-like dessication related protein
MISSTIFKRPLRLLAVVFSIALFSSCKMYQEVSVNEVIDVKVNEFGQNGIKAEVYIQISNPNWYKLSLTESHIELFFEGKSIGEVQLAEKLVLPKKSVTTQTLKIDANYESIEAILANVLQLLFKSEFVLEGKGYVKGKAMFIAKKVPVEFKQQLTKDDLGF